MKFTLVLLIVAAIIGCALSCTMADYEAFKVQFNRVNKSEEENSERMAIFCKTVEDIEKHNAKYKKGLVTYTKGINQFSDMTPEEMKQHFGYLG